MLQFLLTVSEIRKHYRSFLFVILSVSVAEQPLYKENTQLSLPEIKEILLLIFRPSVPHLVQ